jgi:L-2-hydroxyglutarate oxidase LhgO
LSKLIKMLGFGEFEESVVEQADVIVVGAGVVGLATARQLAMNGRDVLILEQAETIGTGISSRNSEVVHGGLYYSSNSLKAKLCVEGRHMMQAYCRDQQIELNACGKIVVAEEAQLPQLYKLKEQGERNGVDDLRILNSGEVNALEPQLRCAAALLSPSSGIIDSHQFMLSLQADAESHGATLACQTPVTRARIENGGITITAGGDASMDIAARLVVNAAGLGAQRFAQAISNFDRGNIPPLHLAKGSYFSLVGKSPFSRLVYPMPEPGGLGIHFTLDLAGAGRFGPDVEWIEQENYDVDETRAATFSRSIAKYWPSITPEMLQPAYAGIRPKVERPGGSATDFIIQGPQQHGVDGLVNLYGIESPGLTSSMAIGKYVAALIANVSA